jgi:hypothetical protein
VLGRRVGVGQNAADLRRGQDDDVRPLLGEELGDGVRVAQVEVRPRRGHDVGESLRRQQPTDR